MQKVNQPLPCRICKGKQKTRCLLCGHKAKKGDAPRKERKEYTKEERRMDYLGGLYNVMRKYNMDTTGLIAKYNGDEDCLIVSNDDTNAVILLIATEEKLTVAIESLTDVKQNLVDEAIVKEIGNPHDPNAQPYIPFRKTRKNEV